jgi:hypothetical protein
MTEMPVPYRAKGYMTKTTNAAVTVLASIPVAENEAVRGTVEIDAIQANAVNGAYFRMRGQCRRRPGANIEVIGVISDTPIRSDASWTATLGINTTTQSIEVRVTGKTGQTIWWYAVVSIMRLKR